jgi:EAL domain-containing protein (putative c-di-GMP-specific phosphodiesterase class I)
VRNLVDDAFDCAAVEAVTRLAHLKGMGVVAEFVEDQRTCDRLYELGVDYAQGYLFHKPEPWLAVPAPAARQASFAGT